MKNVILSLMAILMFAGLSMASETASYIDEDVLESKVLTLEQAAESHARAIGKLNDSVVSLNERLKAVETQVSTKTTQPATSQIVSDKYEVPDIDVPDTPSYGSTGTSFAMSVPTAQYGTYSPPVASGGSTGQFAAYSAPVAVPVAVPVATRVSTRTRVAAPRTGLFARLFNANPVQVQTMPMNRTRAAYCVNQYGEQVPCNQ